MGKTVVREAVAQDMARLNAALAALSRDLGDPYHGSVEVLERACHGPAVFAGAVIAESEGEVVGAALFSPIVSTTLGSSGTRVSDLWVAATERGGGLGRSILAAVARIAEARWDARFLLITVYTENDGATGFYERLGFSFSSRDRVGLLAQDDFVSLIGDTR